MSRKHPQNGPSFSKATIKPKPLTDEELAAYHARKKKQEVEAIAQGKKARRFGAAIRANGGTIPLRGPGTEGFWKKVNEEQ